MVYLFPNQVNPQRRTTLTPRLALFLVLCCVGHIWAQQCGNGIIEAFEQCDDGPGAISGHSNLDFEQGFSHWQIAALGGLNTTTEFTLLTPANETSPISVIQGTQSLRVTLGPGSEGASPALFPHRWTISQTLQVRRNDVLQLATNPGFFFQVNFLFIGVAELVGAACVQDFVAAVDFGPEQNSDLRNGTTFFSVPCGQDANVSQWMHFILAPWQDAQGVFVSPFDPLDTAPFVSFVLTFSFDQPAPLSSPAHFSVVLDKVQFVLRPRVADGCDHACIQDRGWWCMNEQGTSDCRPLGQTTSSDPPVLCGNGIRDVGEDCDDGNAEYGDGCENCREMVGWQCFAAPALSSTCQPIRGDGHLTPVEFCDDGNLLAADGCSPQGQIEDGFECNGQPSICSFTQGS